VVVHIIDIEGVRGVKAKNYPPVCTDGYGSKPLVLAFKPVQPETGHIHISHDAGRVEPRENIAELPGVFGKNAAPVVLFMKALQSLVAYRANHPETRNA
jgi:hypothetical protein